MQAVRYFSVPFHVIDAIDHFSEARKRANLVSENDEHLELIAFQDCSEVTTVRWLERLKQVWCYPHLLFILH